MTAASNRISVNLPVAPGPSVLCYNPQDDKVYCAGGRIDSGYVTVISGATNQILSILHVGTGIADLCLDSP